MSSHDFDYLLVGGGLQNALIALAVLETRPQARVGLIESAAEVAGNHTWSFHAGDAAGAEALIAPLVASSWSGYRVQFPNLERRIDAPYASITSENVRRALERALSRPGCALFTRTRAALLDHDHVTLEDGRRLTAELVVDARGPASFETDSACAYQKFVGLELRLAAPAPDREPVLMDATVAQNDGFRFFYVLPFTPERVLIEDTYFSDSPELSTPALRAEILAYASRKGYAVTDIVREERGVLPLPRRAPRPPALRGPLVAGVQGGWFHPTTGYSLPIALRLARYVASVPPGSVFGDGLRRLVSEHWRQARFAALLNQLLFSAFAPQERWNVLERFYRLPEPTVRRFYALTTTATDRARIVCGRPPKGLSLRAVTRGIHS